MKFQVEKLYEKTKSMYKLVILASRRAAEIGHGAPKLVEGGVKEKPSLIALREIAEDKIGLKVKETRKKTKKK